MTMVMKIGRLVWMTFVGTVLCTTPIGAIFVVGWTYRLMQRRSFAHWRGVSGAVDDGAEVVFPRQLPNWFVREDAFRATRGDWAGPGGVFRKAGLLVRGVFGSFWDNLRVGAQAMANTWAVTLFPCVLWAFSWYAGWDNSFNKGYEQAFVGPLTGLLGVVLFIGVMFYLPMAQARQAATGEWRAFYQFRVVRELVRRRPLASLILAVCYSLASLPLAILITLPTALPQINPGIGFGDMEEVELLKYLNDYFFRVSFLGFALFVLVRVLTARIYASALLDGVLSGGIDLAALCTREKELLTLGGVEWSKSARSGRGNYIRRIVTGPLRGGLVALTIFVWFTFVAQIFVGTFLNYHSLRGWLNQPLVQAPWFSYIPSHLHGPPN